MAKRVWLWGIIVFLLISAPMVAGYWVFLRIQDKLDVSIAAKYEPVLLAPEFKLSELQFKWDERVEFVSGSVKIRYNLSKLLQGRLRVILSGENLDLKLLGSWAQTEGVEVVHVKHLKADIELGDREIQEIYELKIDSPEFQFQIQKNDN